MTLSMSNDSMPRKSAILLIDSSLFLKNAYEMVQAF